MTRRKTRLKTISVGVLGCAVLLWAIMRPAPPEPMYHGKTVTQWLCSSDYLTARRRVDWAILSMGKRCVPTLRRHLREGMKWERVCFQKAPLWLRWRWPRHRSLYDIRERALYALEILKSDGQLAAPELISMMCDRSEFFEFRVKAMSLLHGIEGDSSRAIAVLDSLANDPDLLVRQDAINRAKGWRNRLAIREQDKVLKRITESQSKAATNGIRPAAFLEVDEIRLSLTPNEGQISADGTAPRPGHTE